MLIASSSKLKWQPNGSVIPPGTSASARWVWPSCATGTASRRSRGRTHMARTATAPIPQEPTDADKAREALRHQRLRTRHKGEASESEIPASLTPSSAPRSVSPLSVPPTRRTRRREDPTPVADVLTAWVTRQGIALPPNCGICGSRGFVIEQRRSLMAPPYCSCEWGMRARRRDDIDRSTMLLEVHRGRREALARKLVLPAQHQRFTLETHPLANRQEQGHAMYVDVLSWLAHWDWRRGLILLGGYGIGKKIGKHTSELQSHSDLRSFPTRRSSDLCWRCIAGVGRRWRVSSCCRRSISASRWRRTRWRTGKSRGTRCMWTC